MAGGVPAGLLSNQKPTGAGRAEADQIGFLVFLLSHEIERITLGRILHDAVRPLGADLGIDAQRSLHVAFETTDLLEIAMSDFLVSRFGGYTAGNCGP